MKLSVCDLILIIGFSFGLFVGIIYTKIKYALPLFQLF